MARHPKERPPRVLRVPSASDPHGLSRRDFLKRSAGAAAALSGASAFLAACGHASPTALSSSASGGSGLPYPLARPDHPATWPITADNPAIASNLQPEKGATLQLFNWADYIWKKLVNDFAEMNDCKVEITTFDNTDEFLAKMRTGDVSYDVCWPTPDQMGKLTTAKLLQPLNHDYLPNLSNVWPQLQDPFYDKGSHYSVPYTIYSTGIGYRKDFVKTDPFTMENGYELFWDTAYKGKTYILDDYRETTAMALLKNGYTDVNTGDATALNKAKADLLSLIEAVNVKYDVNDYTEIPEGRAWVHQAWSGDMVSAPYYLPKGVSVDVIGYWYPQDRPGVVGSDIIAIPKAAKNPVLAHMFLNYMLDSKIAYSNFYNFNGYQPPQNDIDPDTLVSRGAIPKDLTATVVRPEDFDRAYQLLELPPSVDIAWHAVWQEFQAGA